MRIQLEAVREAASAADALRADCVKVQQAISRARGESAATAEKADQMRTQMDAWTRCRGDATPRPGVIDSQSRRVDRRTEGEGGGGVFVVA
jgi:hypothetical protein